MKKQIKFLICGFGNIAQRHYRNLRKLLPKSIINVYTHKYDKHRIFDNNLHITYTDDIKSVYNIDNIYYNIDDALNACEYNAVIVCTLPPDRLDICIKSAKRDFNLFIEKPLSSTVDPDKIQELLDIVKENNIKVAMGYQMRFSPVIQEIKKCISNNKIGEIYRVEITHGNNIKNWTKGRKLSDFYAMNKDAGGGVLLSQIHELDYLNYIIDDNLYPISAISNSKNENGVDVNVVITGDVIINYNGNNTFIPVVISLDFLNPEPYRKIKIFGRKGAIFGDLIYNNVLSCGEMKHFNYLWNDLFLDEMKSFIKFITGKKSKRFDADKLATLNDGINSLEIVHNIKDILL